MSEVSERPTEPKRSDQSLGELFKELTTELGDLFHREVELAKVETREQLRRSARARPRWPWPAWPPCCC